MGAEVTVILTQPSSVSNPQVTYGHAEFKLYLGSLELDTVTERQSESFWKRDIAHLIVGCYLKQSYCCAKGK